MFSKKEFMTEKELLAAATSIEPPDRASMKEAEARQIKLAKPPRSLGKLESISIQMAGITGKLYNDVEKSCVVVFCADNGVFDEGVAATPQSVTMSQTINFTRKLTGVGALARAFNSDILVVDMGVKDEIPSRLYTDDPAESINNAKILDRSMGKGTKNIAKGPAMSTEDAIACIGFGIEASKACEAQGFDIMGIGEMGIANTTTSAAVLSALVGKDSSFTVGRGAGLDDKGLARKCEIVDKASAPYRNTDKTANIGSDSATNSINSNIGSNNIVNSDRSHRNPDSNICISSIGGIKHIGALNGYKFKTMEVVDILAHCGGFDICAMAGAYIGAALCKMPVVIDGYISVVAALAAEMLAPGTKNYMFPSHKSEEKGYVEAIAALGIEPFLALDMRLGEGSGCPIAFEIIRGACSVLKNMATFDEAAIDDDYIASINHPKFFA